MEVSENGATPIAGWVYFMTPILKWMIWGTLHDKTETSISLHLRTRWNPVEPGFRGPAAAVTAVAKSTPMPRLSMLVPKKVSKKVRG